MVLFKKNFFFFATLLSTSIVGNLATYSLHFTELTVNHFSAYNRWYHFAGI